MPDNVERDHRETAFIKKVEQVVVRKSFENYEELQSAVYASLVRYLEEKELLRLLPFDASHHPHTTLDDIDPEKITTFIRKARIKRNSKLSENLSPEQLLTHLNLLDSQGRVTNAAILLFGKKPQRFFISSEVKCIQFYGNEAVKPVPVYHIYTGDLFELIEQAVSFVMSRIDIWVSDRSTGVSVDTKYELPLQAVTEAIVNAIAHRDYTSNGSVQVMLFRNRLEVWNPGVLPQGMTIEKLFLPHNSIPHNPLIANPLYLSGDIEKAGTGISDMIEQCVEMGLKKPEFTQDSNFSAILWRSEKGDSVQDNNQNINSSNHDSNYDSNYDSNHDGNYDKKILAFATTPKSRTEIMEGSLGISSQTKNYERHIVPLLEKGLLAMTLPDKPKSKNQKYVTTEKGKKFLN